MKNTLKKIKKYCLDIIFPPLCISCKSNLETKRENLLNLCLNCEEKIETNPNKDTIYLNNKQFDYIYGSMYENKIIRNMIHNLKYKKIKYALNSIKIKIIKPTVKKYIDNFKEKDWIIIPIPIHSSKKIERGFNQSSLIAESLSDVLNKNDIRASVENNILIKAKKTESQTKLKRKNRRKNIKGAFKLIKDGNLKGKDIILVDDVFTTGSTIKEAIKELDNADYKSLVIFTVTKN